MADMTFNWPRLKCPRFISPRRPVGAEDIRDLQVWHEVPYAGRAGSRGLKTLRKVSVATWV